jgi:hypothetical protein
MKYILRKKFLEDFSVNIIKIQIDKSSENVIRLRQFIFTGEEHIVKRSFLCYDNINFIELHHEIINEPYTNTDNGYGL